MPSPTRASFCSLFSALVSNETARSKVAARYPSGLPSLAVVGLLSSKLYHDAADRTFGRHPDLRAGFALCPGGTFDTMGREAVPGVLTYAAVRFVAATQGTRLRPGLIGLAAACGITVGLGLRDGRDLRSQFDSTAIVRLPPRYLVATESGRKLCYPRGDTHGTCDQILRPNSVTDGQRNTTRGAPAVPQPAPSHAR